MEEDKEEEEAVHKVNLQIWVNQPGNCSIFSVEKAFFSGFPPNILTAFYISWLPQATR